MTDQEALYRAIVASPEEDTPRLVYADWLDENGRAEEAEFIRLDCQLEEAGPELPDYVERIERREELRLWLEAQAPGQKLRLKEGLQLLGGWWANTARGFPRLFEIHMRGRLGSKGVKRIAAALADAFKHIPTRWVGINTDDLGDLAEFLRQPVVSALDSITINSLGLAGDEAARLIADSPGLSNLRGIYLSFAVGDTGVAALCRSEHLHRLRRLDIVLDPLAPGTLRNLAKAAWFSHLSELYFDNGLGSSNFETLCQVSDLPNLHTLSLSSASLSLAAWNTFAESRAFPRLRRLILANTDMGWGPITALARATNVRLSALDLRRCSVGDEGVRELIEAPWLGSLQALDLSLNWLGYSAARMLVRCRELTGLRYLDLSGNRVGANTLRALAARQSVLKDLISLKVSYPMESVQPPTETQLATFIQALNFPRLRHLNLSGLPTGIEAARALATEKFRSLRRLDLSHCRLTDEAVSTLLTSSSLQNLIDLSLNDNDLATGVSHLTDRRVLPYLSRCPLQGNPIDPELARKLKRRPGVSLSSE